MSCVCQKIGHLARVCIARSKSKALVTQADTKQSKVDPRSKKLNEVHQLETTDTTAELSSSRSSEEEEHLHTILQLGDKSRKFQFTTNINGINIDMELDSVADRCTVPWALFQKKLSGVCKPSA